MHSQKKASLLKTNYREYLQGEFVGIMPNGEYYGIDQYGETNSYDRLEYFKTLWDINVRYDQY